MLASLTSLTGCVTQQILPYHASVANQMKLGSVPPTARFQVASNESQPSDVQTIVRTVRIQAPGDGSWSTYLNQALRTELTTSGNYDASAPLQIEGILTEVHIFDGSAELIARFVVRRDQSVRYDKVLHVDERWDTQFLGALAASDGMNQTTAVFQDLLRKLFEDPDFIKAAQQSGT